MRHDLPSKEDRRVSVEAALANVVDPELDEGLMDLGFIDQIDLAGHDVAVTLRLPTYWCSANFAFIMGEDIKAAIGDLPWVRSITVRLVDHFAMEKINRGLAETLVFEAVFGDEAGGDLGQIRSEFRHKAYLGRQATVLQALRRQKLDPSVIVGMSIIELQRFAAKQGDEFRAQVDRYLEARRGQEAPSDPLQPAFLDEQGEPIPAGALLGHLRAVRRIRGSLEANSEMCRILHAARYGSRAAPFAAAAGRCNSIPS